MSDCPLHAITARVSDPDVVGSGFSSRIPDFMHKSAVSTPNAMNEIKLQDYNRGPLKRQQFNKKKKKTFNGLTGSEAIRSSILAFRLSILVSYKFV